MANLEFLDTWESTKAADPTAADPTVARPTAVRPTGTDIIADTEEAPALSAQQQAARIKRFLDAGMDAQDIPIIYRLLGEPKIGEGAIGFVGSAAERMTRTDVIPTEVEKLLGPDYLNRIEELYGAPEVQVPRDEASFIQQLITRLVGRAPSESEVEAEQIASERGGSVDFFTRYLKETLGGKMPTLAEMQGAAAAGASPAERALIAKYGYQPVSDVASQKVELELYGRTPIRDPEAFKELTARANEAIRWLSELPKGEDPSGKEYSVAEDLIGQILLTDINMKYGTDNKRFTLEDLDLKMQPTASGRKLTFMHPDPDVGRQPIDPVTLDWSDVADQLPGAYVIFADVLGSIGGGILGSFATPVSGTFLGATAGGALGAVVSKYMVIDKARRMGEFTYDHSKGGWVSFKTGEEQVIPLGNIFDDLVTEGLWSAGGAVLGSTLFRLGKAIFTKGGSEAEHFVRQEDWDDAYRRWGENKFGKKFSKEGIPASPSYILEAGARELREAAKETFGKEADDLIARAGRMDASASQLRQMEKNILPEAAVVRERMLESLEEGTRTIDGKIIPPAAYDDVEKFGRQVEVAIRSGDGTRINNLLDGMGVANQKLINEWEQIFKSAGAETDAAFGLSIREAAQRALGLVGGRTATTAKTGIYGRRNAIRNAGKIYGQKAWNLQKVSDQVEKDLRSLSGAFKGETKAYPSDIAGTFLRLRQRAVKKEGIPVTYSEVQQLLDMVSEAAEKATGGNARRLWHLHTMLRTVEGQGLKNVNPGLYKKWQTSQAEFTDFKQIWHDQFERGLTDLNSDQLANRFLKSMNDDTTVSSILGSLKQLEVYGREQEDILRNILKVRLRSALTRELKPGEGIEIAGKARNIKIGDQRFSVNTISASQFEKFQNEYGSWIRQLFPNDPKLENFALKVARSQTLTGRYDKIARMEKALKDLPFLQRVAGTDLQKLAIEEPHKLYDLIWQSGRSGTDNTRSIKELNRILKRGLQPDEFALAQQRLKALTLKKIWNPDEEFAAATGKQFSARDVTAKSLGFLNRERTALIEVFGKSHFNNLRALFREMDAAANPKEMGVAGFMARQLEKESALAKIPGLIAKVWVGVLNKKARALTLGTKFIVAGEQKAFAGLLSDPKALDRALKLRSSRAGRISANALGSILFGKEEGKWREDEIQQLLDTFTITDAEGNRQPVPEQTQKQGRTEAIDRIVGGFSSGGIVATKRFAEGGLNEVPSPPPPKPTTPKQAMTAQGQDEWLADLHSAIQGNSVAQLGLESLGPGQFTRMLQRVRRGDTELRGIFSPEGFSDKTIKNLGLDTKYGGGPVDWKARHVAVPTGRGESPTEFRGVANHELTHVGIQTLLDGGLGDSIPSLKHNSFRELITRLLTSSTNSTFSVQPEGGAISGYKSMDEISADTREELSRVVEQINSAAKRVLTSEQGGSPSQQVATAP